METLIKPVLFEISEWLGVSYEEARSRVLVNLDCVEEWNTKKDVYDFHKKTFYFIATLMNWEVTTKKGYTDELVTFVECWKHYPIKTFLDHGTGIGYDSIRLAQEAGCDLYLYEMDSPHLDFAIWRLKKRGLFHKVREVLKVTKENPTPDFPLVDFISTIAVIEHLENPQRDLKHILDRTRYIAIRVDPCVEKGKSSATHFDTNVEFLVKLNGQDPDLLNELGIKRINYTSLPIYEVTRNVPLESRVIVFKQSGHERIWSR